MLARRLATLEGRQLVLHTASVLGEQFDADLVANVAGASVREVEVALHVAERARVVHRVDDSGRRWAFVHVLFQQVCTRGLRGEARVDLHRRVADAFEEAPDGKGRCASA